jgi:DNA-binding MarR family transcriptional regulator
MTEGQGAAPTLGSVQLMEQFRAIAHATHNRTNARMSAAGLSLARFRVLSALQSAGRMRMNELSAALGVVPRTVTTSVDALEKEGMVVRLPDPADRRATLLEITQDGLRQLHRLRATHDSAAAELFDVLTATERQQLARILQRLQAAADADPGPDSSGRPGLAHPQPPSADLPAQ